MDIRAYPNLYPKRAVGLRPRSTWVITCNSSTNGIKPDRPCFRRPSEGRRSSSPDDGDSLGRAIYTVGYWIRGTGQAIDRLGCRLQGNYLFQEQRNLCLHNVDSLFPLVFSLRLCKSSSSFLVSLLA
ncbi:hypothetical protein BHM03_00055839 [Ensete ventricosum]|nr:hypothetical protein BHM03_00055839 [Ensete ventricosum]